MHMCTQVTLDEEVGCHCRADVYASSNRAAQLRELLDQHPAVERAAPEATLLDCIQLAAGTGGCAHRRQHLEDAKLCPGRHDGLLSEWLAVVFQHQLPRGLHRWVAWTQEQADLMRKCSPVITAALDQLSPQALWGSKVPGQQQAASLGEQAEATRLLGLMQESAWRGWQPSHEAPMLALFTRLDVRCQLLFCAGVVLLFGARVLWTCRLLAGSASPTTQAGTCRCPCQVLPVTQACQLDPCDAHEVCNTDLPASKQASREFAWFGCRGIEQHGMRPDHACRGSSALPACATAGMPPATQPYQPVAC